MEASDENGGPESSAQEPDVVYDNFYSPENRDFYAQKPYKPLSSRDHEIRLLRQLPSDGSNVLSFTMLDNVPLKSVSGKYTALSYCAGDPRNTARIMVNGLEFNAFANLNHALTEVVEYGRWWSRRDGVEGRLLWVDQVSINQSDQQERSQQVEMMRKIYASADRVLVCLAEKECDGTPLEWVTSLLDRLLRDGCPGFGRSPQGKPFPAWEEKNHVQCEKLLTKRATKSPLYSQAGFLSLINSPWWGRCWVCQEFVVARDIDLMYGGLCINWKQYLLVLCHLVETRKKYLSFLPFESIMPLERLVLFMVKKYEWNKSETLKFSTAELKSWLHYGRLCEASDARDKVFAFIGLASEEYRIVPNYSPSMTVGEVLIQTAVRIIEVDRNLDILLHTASPRANSISGKQVFNTVVGKVPSWVPDWTSKPRDRKEPIQTRLICQTPPRVVSGTRLLAEGFHINRPGSPLDVALRAQSTPEIFRYSGYSRWGLRQNEDMWYFPPTTAIFKLKMVDSHWEFIDLAQYSVYYSSLSTSKDEELLDKVRRGNVAWFLEPEQGLTKEVIEIH